MGKKISKEEFEERINVLYNGAVDVSKFNFTSTSEKGLCKCNICGYEWQPIAYSLLAGHGCRKCYDKRNSDNRKMNLETIQDKIDKCGKHIRIIGEYVDTKHDCLAHCDKCGHEWRTKPSFLIRGSDCPKCASYAFSAEDFKKMVKEKFGGKYGIDRLDYQGISKKVTLTCEKHGDFMYGARSLMNTKREELCPFCLKEAKELSKKAKIEKIVSLSKPKKLSVEEKRDLRNEKYLERIKQVHNGSDYDFDSIEFIGSDSVSIVCNKHGRFTTNLWTFLEGHKCPKCMHRSYAYTTDEWVRKAKEIHPEFGYEKTVYTNKSTPLIVTCPAHGDVSVYPNAFLRTAETPCPRCREDLRRKTKSEEYWSKIKEIYDGKGYEILGEGIINTYDKIEVRCRKHDAVFTPTVANVLKLKCGCPKCSMEEYGLKSRLSVEEVKKRINEIHNGKYDLRFFKEYNGIETKIPVICPEHGLMTITAHSLLAGQGCVKCGYKEAGLKNRCTHEEFIEKVKKVHCGKKLDFSETKYTKNNEFVKVYCKEKFANGEEHGVFHIKAVNLLVGNGCPKCNMSHLEQKVRAMLVENGIVFVGQKRFGWLGLQSLDFYIPELNIAIECQGSQHFNEDFFISKGVDYAKNNFKVIQERDSRKKSLCKENNVRLVYFLEKRFAEFMKEGDIYFTGTEDLLAFIKKVRK